MDNNSNITEKLNIGNSGIKYCFRCMSVITNTELICPYCGKTPKVGVPLHHLLPGTILNKKYMVGAALGEGGFGITYIGRDLLLDMKVAIKEYFPTGYVNRSNTVSPAVTTGTEGERLEFFEVGRERFLSEARTLAKYAGQRGIVNVRDFFAFNNTAYIVMEYLDGLNLKDYLKQYGVMYYADVLNLLRPIMVSLCNIHRDNLIHRDIAPDNIMIVNGEPKLLDFGAARNVSAVAAKSLSVVLKPGYAPEEQYRSKGEQGPWTDIYALCATIYKCITGKTPDDATQRMYKDELKRPSELGVQIPRNIEDVIMKGLNVVYTDRYRSIDEMLMDLDRANSVGGTVFVPNNGLPQTAMYTQPDAVSRAVYQDRNVSEKPVEKSEKKSGNLKWFILGGVALAAIVVGVLVAVLLNKPGNSGSDHGNEPEKTVEKDTDEETDISDGEDSSTKPDTSKEDDDPETNDGNVSENPSDSTEPNEDGNEPGTEDGNGTETGSEDENAPENNEQSNEMTILFDKEYTDSLSAEDEQKIYHFSLKDEGAVWLTYSHDYIEDDSSYWKCSVYNSDGFMLAKMNFYGTDSEAKDSRKIGLPAGQYYLLQTAGDYYSDLNYTLSLHYDDDNVWEQELNDVKDDSNKITVNEEVHGAITRESDVDWYRFDVKEEGSIAIDFGNMKKDKAKNYWNADIYDASGKLLLTASFHGKTEEYETSKSISVEPGTYYLCVGQGDSYSVFEYFFKINFEPKPEITPEPDPGYVNYVEYDAKNMISSYSCSSVLVEPNFNHEIKNIFDGKTDSCWCEGADDVGIGEYIEINFKEKILVSELDIYNGYSKSEKSYNNNGKLTTARLYYDGGFIDVDFASLKWADINGDKFTDRFRFSVPIETSFIRIEITGAVKGAKFTDTCISEVRVLAVTY